MFVLTKQSLFVQRRPFIGSRWAFWLLGWHKLLAALVTIITFGTWDYTGELPASGRFLRSVKD